MSPQVSQLVESFVTVRTLVAFLSVVRLQMSHLGGGVRESLIAEVALVRLLAAVHQLVALQVARCGEQLAAHVAAVTRLTCVALAVQVEQTDLPVALPTSGAAVRLQRAVCFLVSFTRCRVRESFVTVPTAERLLSCVDAHVSLEITSVGEFLPTILTFVRHGAVRLRL